MRELWLRVLSFTRQLEELMRLLYAEPPSS
jgi:hypothetical protein